jgi:hypothetical protein
MFGMLGIFSEFEREMIVARVNAVARAKEAIARNGEFRSKAGKIRGARLLPPILSRCSCRQEPLRGTSGLAAARPTLVCRLGYAFFVQRPLI